MKKFFRIILLALVLFSLTAFTAFVANTASAMLTFFSLETIMDIMFKAIR